MSYTLHQLLVFDAVATKGSITKAAEYLNMTQPAVSIQLKQLQEHFGISLTEVIGRTTHLTEAGRQLHTSIRALNLVIDEMESQMEELRGLVRGSLQFSVVSTVKYFMPYFLGYYKQSFPGISLKLNVTNRLMVLDQLRKNEIDFAVVSIIPDDIDVDSLAIMDNPLVLAAPPDFKVLKHPISFSDLTDASFIVREEGSGTRMVMLDLFKRYHMNPQISMELSTTEAVKQAIMAGLGISIVSRFSLKSERINRDILELELNNFPIMTQWYLVWLKGKRFSPAARHFVSFMSSKKNHIIQSNFRWVFEPNYL